MHAFAKRSAGLLAGPGRTRSSTSVSPRSATSITYLSSEHPAHATEPGIAARALAARALWHLGAFEQAIEVARSISERFAQSLSKAQRGPKPRVLPVRPITQQKTMCVAASVSMALRTLGRAADPAVIFREMGESEGVASWQLDRWLRRSEIEPVDVPLELTTVKQVLESGFPLLATRSGILMSHMELVVGYDDGLRELESLDPATGFPEHVLYDHIGDVYGQAGDALVALIPVPLVERVPPHWRDRAASLRRRIVRAIFDGEVERAQALLRELGPSTPTALRLRFQHHDQLCPPRDLVEVVRAIVASDRIDATTRFMATIALQGLGEPEEAKQALAKAVAQPHPFFRAFMRLHIARERGDWSRMRKRTEILLERAGALAQLWELYADALEGCGEFAAASRARAVCLEIEPDHVESCLQALDADPATPLAEKEARVRALLDRHPNSAALLGTAARLAFDQGRPLECKELLGRNVRLNPHGVAPLLQLRAFYLFQGRADLAPPVGRTSRTRSGWARRRPSRRSFASPPRSWPPTSPARLQGAHGSPRGQEARGPRRCRIREARASPRSHVR